MGRSVDAQAAQVTRPDHAAIKQITSEDEPTEQRVESSGRNAIRSCAVELLTGVSEVVQQVPVNAVSRVEITLVFPEELPRFNGDQELLELRRHAVEDGDEARKVRLVRRYGIRSDHARVYMHPVVGYQYQNGSAAVVPEPPMQFVDGLAGDTMDLFEIHQWRVIRAQHTIDFEKIERPPEQMRLGSCRAKIFRACEEARRFLRGDAELLLPFGLIRSGHS